MRAETAVNARRKQRRGWKRAQREVSLQGMSRRERKDVPPRAPSIRAISRVTNLYGIVWFIGRKFNNGRPNNPQEKEGERNHCQEKEGKKGGGGERMVKFMTRTYEFPHFERSHSRRSSSEIFGAPIVDSWRAYMVYSQILVSWENKIDEKKNYLEIEK